MLLNIIWTSSKYLISPLAPMVTTYCAAKLLDFAALGVPPRQHCYSAGTRTIILLIAVFLVKKRGSLDCIN